MTERYLFALLVLFITPLIQYHIRQISDEVDTRVRVGRGPDASARHQIIAYAITRSRCADERRVYTEVSR
jgi:hypothetical protein